METIDWITVLSVAFLGSIGHCIGMCGGFVVAYSTSKVEKSQGRLSQMTAHLLYNLGRITSYAFIGALFGLLGAAFKPVPAAHGVLFAFIGLLMILIGLSLMGKGRFLNSVEASFAGSTWFRRQFQRLIASQNPGSFYLLGMLNGFVPCGFVYFFAVTAAGTASPLWGAAVMAVFGIATIPALFSLGFTVGFLQQTKWRTLMVKLASLMVIGYGGLMLYKGYTLAFVQGASCH